MVTNDYSKVVPPCLAFESRLDRLILEVITNENPASLLDLTPPFHEPRRSICAEHEYRPLAINEERALLFSETSGCT